MLFVIDNFLKEPDIVVDWANTLDYPITKENFPGRRTKELNEVSREFKEELIQKVANVFTKHTFYTEATMFFQKVPDVYKTGVIHNDEGFTAIIYLNKNGNAGTSTYTMNNLKPILKPYDHRTLWEADDIKGIEKLRNEYNDCYTEDIRVSGKYNRMIFFKGTQPHGANSFVLDNAQENEERLTLIMFFNVLGCRRIDEYLGEHIL